MKCCRSRAGRWIASAAALFLVGCGGPGTLTGKATLDGKALPGGIVTVFDKDGNAYSGGIDKSGNYLVANIPPGTCTVTVTTVQKGGGSIAHPDGGEPNPYGEYVKIPLKYRDKAKSGFTVDVKSGKQDYPLALKDEPDEARKQ